MEPPRIQEEEEVKRPDGLVCTIYTVCYVHILLVWLVTARG